MTLIAALSWFEVADACVLACGTLVLVVFTVRHWRHRTWSSLTDFPAPPAQELTLVDVLLSLAVFLYFPSLAASMIERGGAESVQDISKPSLSQLTLGQTMGQFLAIVVLIVLGRARFTGGLVGWGLRFRGAWKDLLHAVWIFVAISPVIFVIFQVTQWTLGALGIESAQHASIELLQDDSMPRWLRGMSIFNALVLASVVEELFFRGVLQAALSRGFGSVRPAIVITSLLFGAIHYPYLETIPPLMVFGMILGWLYARTGSLSLVIFLHAVFNGKTLLFLALGATVD